MSWFAESRIEIIYVLLQPDWRDNIHTTSDHSFRLCRDTSSNTKKNLKLSLNCKVTLSSGSTPRATEEHASSKEFSSPSPTEASVINNTQVSNGSSSIPYSPLSSEEQRSPPPKTSSSGDGPHAVPSTCEKRSFAGTPSSSRKPQKFAHSSADHTLSAKKPQPFTCQDLTSPTQKNDSQVNPSENSVSTGQSSPSSGPPSPASTQPTSPGESASDPSPNDLADSV